jgi:hypothetical protein
MPRITALTRTFALHCVAVVVGSRTEDEQDETLYAVITSKASRELLADADEKSFVRTGPQDHVGPTALPAPEAGARRKNERPAADRRAVY